LVLASPVPTYTVFGASGAMAMAPTDCVTNESLTDVQLSPAFVVFHTPPFAPPMYAVLALVGSTASAVRRPVEIPMPAP
jgi:hypothetical protein